MGKEELLESTVEITVARDAAGVIHVLDEQYKALLVVLSGGRIGQRVVLGADPMLIGRGSACSLILQGDSISRQHARIEWTGSTHVLMDLGSTNGSFVNYERVGRRELNDGDHVQIGKTLLKYLAGDNPEAKYHENLDRLVRHDALTGALNKGAFEEELYIACGSGAQGVVSLILFDLDHFKRVNDEHGHTAGDMVLRGVGSTVRSVVGESAQFGRVGGEEFALLVTGERREAAALAEQIRAAVAAQHFVFDEVVIPVTLSLGVCQRAIDESPDELYERTDRQLYAAKHGGRNRLSVG